MDDAALPPFRCQVTVRGGRRGWAAAEIDMAADAMGRFDTPADAMKPA
jgi:hypothetical protein